MRLRRVVQGASEFACCEKPRRGVTLFSALPLAPSRHRCCSGRADMSSTRLPDRGVEFVVFVGDAVSAARSLARAFGRIGYAPLEAASSRRIGLHARPPAAVVVAAAAGVDPFRVVANVRAREGFAHAFVFVWTPANEAHAEPFDDAIDRIEGLACARTLRHGATVVFEGATRALTDSRVCA